VLVTTIAADGTVQLGEDARRLGFEPGKVVQVIRTSGGSLILALHDAAGVDRGDVEAAACGHDAAGAFAEREGLSDA